MIADISRRYARGTADVTDRQNIQLHWIEIENVPAIWDALESVGLSTTEACGDTPRVILGCPLAGLDASEIIDATPEITAIGAQYIGDPAFSNLPRKFKSSISGCSAQCAIHEINDVAFVGVLNSGGEAGYDLWVGGGLSTNPMIGQRLGAFVRPGQVPEVWAGVAGLFRDYGYRRLRHRARIKFLVADWGPEKFREVLEKEYLGYALPDGPRARGARRGGIRDHVGVHPQRDGLNYVGFAPTVGRLSADAARRHRRPGRAGTAAAGCAPPPSRRWSSWTCRRSAPRSWSPSWRRPASRRGRARSAGTPWRAPASSSASSRSWRPRRGRPT